MSFRKMLKSKGPKIDPCGTPSSTFAHSLKEFYFATLKSVCKIAFHKLTELLSELYALSFASSKAIKSFR